LLLSRFRPFKLNASINIKLGSSNYLKTVSFLIGLGTTVIQREGIFKINSFPLFSSFFEHTALHLCFFFFFCNDFIF